MSTGKFITFEGGEGAGKSTQAALLQAALVQRGIAAVTTREPGGSPFAEQVRDFLLHGGGRTSPGTALAESLMFFAARADHLDQKIRPALRAGSWVLCDRFIDSTRAYQGAASGVAAEALLQLEQLVVVPTMPDLTVILDLPAVEGLRRASDRYELGKTAEAGRDAFEQRNIVFHEALRAGFLAIAATEPQRCVVVDARQSVAEVSRLIWSAVATRLGVA
jgi:dTMP kinase